MTYGELTWGFDLDNWEKYGAKTAIRLPLISHCHALVTGASGSGKSMSLIYIIGKILQSSPDIELTICDFKCSEEFRFLERYSRFFAGDACIDGLESYYKSFTKARQNGEYGKRHLLIFDEYPAFVSYLQNQDRLNKTKNAPDVLGVVAEILMLGRGLRFGIFIACQRPDAAFFQSGARDNFMIYLALGRLSKEQRGMVFPGEEIPDRIYHPGEGVLLADGCGLKLVKFPLIVDMTDWNKHVVEILTKTDR